MNSIKATTMAIVMALAGGGATAQAADDAPIIGKPQVKIENGMMTAEVLNSLSRLSDPQVSPDGKLVLYGVQYRSIEQNKGNNELWVMNIDGTNQHQITNTKGSESNGVWIEGGKRIAFVYDGQMWVMNPDGTGRQQVSNLKGGVEGFVLSPDEKHVVLITDVDYGVDAHKLYPDVPKTDAIIASDLMYRHWNEWTSQIPQPVVADFNGTSISNEKNVLEGTQFESPMRPWGGVEQLAWTPDSRQLIYVCRKKVGRDYAVSTNSDLYVYDLATGTTVKNLTEDNKGYDNNPIVSRSGKIAWLSMERDGYEADKNRIMLLNPKTGVKQDLTADWDYSVDAIAWSPDEKYIYFICPYQGTCPIFRMEVKNRKVEPVAEGQYDYSGLQVLPGGKVITTRVSYSDPADIFLAQKGKEPVQLTAVNKEILDQLAPISCYKELIPATDGEKITTWVALPPNFDETKKYPAILFCEGGPQSPVSQFWSYRWNIRIMAAHGYVVILPNRRGLPGFGTKWNEQISGDYGGQNMKDYLSATDYMAQKPWIDKDRIGAVGASYGGYSVYWLAGNHHKRFKAFISHCGIFDLRAQYCETEEQWFTNWDLGGAPWETDNAVAQKTYREADPKNFVKNWDTPILCITGENDFRISYSQSLQAFNSARTLGVPARLLVFPSECHWVLKPQNSIVWQREYFSWLDKWLKK